MAVAATAVVVVAKVFFFFAAQNAAAVWAACADASTLARMSPSNLSKMDARGERVQLVFLDRRQPSNERSTTPMSVGWLMPLTRDSHTCAGIGSALMRWKWNGCGTAAGSRFQLYSFMPMVPTAPYFHVVRRSKPATVQWYRPLVSWSVAHGENRLSVLPSYG